MQTTRFDGFLLDSGILIRDLRGDDRARALIEALARRAPLATSSVSAFEILRGARSERQEAAATMLLEQLEVVSVDFHVARIAADLMRRHRGKFSSERSVPDALIAAAAAANQLILVTLNRRQFARIPEVNVLLVDQESRDWTRALR